MIARRLVLLFPFFIFAALAIIFASLLEKGPRHGPAPTALVGSVIPDFTLTPVAGVNMPLLKSETMKKGELSVLNVFASWCGPCRIEHPELVRLAQAGVVIYGINYKDIPEDARRYLNSMGNPYCALGADEKGSTGLALGLSGVPESFVIDGQGRVLAHVPGPLTSDLVAAVIRPALTPAPDR